MTIYLMTQCLNKLESVKLASVALLHMRIYSTFKELIHYFEMSPFCDTFVLVITKDTKSLFGHY